MGISSSRAISLPAIIAGLGGGNAVGTNAVAVGATLTNSLSTGNATNPNFVIQVGVKTGSGATQATATTALTIAGETLAATFAGTVSLPSGAAQLLFSTDLLLGRAAAANLRLGAADVDTGPVGQVLSVQNTLAGGTSNVAGADRFYDGSQGKGTGIGGSHIFRVSTAGSSGTTVNALANALIVKATGTNPVAIGADGSAATVTGVSLNNDLGDSTNIGLFADTNTLYAQGTVGVNLRVGNQSYVALTSALFRTILPFTALSGTSVPAGGTAGSGLMFSSVANFGMFFGSGAPTLAAAQGSLYLRSDGSTIATRLYVNTTGSTTWTSFTSAA